MGAFYTNLVVRPAAPDEVVAALTTLGRDAFVAAGRGGAAVVFDAATESQDARAVETLAGGLTKRLGCVGLAVVNHDDGLLYYALFERGRLEDEYNSSPGYFEGGDDAPTGGDAKRLCRAFDVSGRADDVARVLHETEYVLATERHAELVGLLGLPAASIGCGYETIVAGEPPEEVGLADLRTVGAAVVPTHASPPPSPPPSPAESEATLSKLRGLVRPSPQLAAVVGPAPLPYGTVVMKVLSYVTRHGLSDAPTQTVRADAALRAVYGVDRVPYNQLGVALDAHLTPVAEDPPKG